MSSLTLQSTAEIAPGLHIPRLGFGVYASPTSICQRSVQNALNAGYRHIDSAVYYGNEKEVGRGVKASGIPREEIFITTKILTPPKDANGNFSEEKLYDELTAAVDKFELGYVDLFLIHSPTPGPEGRLLLWKGLEKLKTAGKTRAIGVSNFGVKHLQQLAEAGLSKPAVNQIELHPWCQQKDIVAYCQEKSIVVEAYCPLVRGEKFDDPTLYQLAIDHIKDPAQILVRWSLQKGYIPLPKSDTPSRIKSNADVFDFELTAEEMAALDALDQGAKGAIAPNNVDCP